MSSIDHTRDLEAVIRTALADEEIDGVETTLDVTMLPGHLEGDALVVLVNPPTITFETYSHATYAHKVWVVCGPSSDMTAAWARLSPAVDAIALAAGADEAEPSSFQDPRGTTYPAYIITISN